MSPTPQRIVIIGAGGRGRDAYGRWVIDHPERAQVVAVADTDETRRRALATAAGGAVEYGDWREVIPDLARLEADGVVIAVPDAMHVDVAIAVADAGLPFLLEKPAAPTLVELERLAIHAGKVSARLAIGHVLRFTPFWRTIKQIIDAGTLGQVMTIEVRENIGFWHFAHSYVRGNWRNSATSSAMVLAKTSHDLDLIRWIAGGPPESVYSIGGLSWFRPENAPEGAPAFCLDGCPVADTCPFFAPRYYVDALAGVHGHPVHLLGDDTSVAGRLKALRTGDYGRCVFRSDNDVADHQQTTMLYPGGLTATLTASAFTAENTRVVAITGSAGQLTGHMESGELVVDLFSPQATLPPDVVFAHQETTVMKPMGHTRHALTVVVPGADLGDHAGHAGGDAGFMAEFVDALGNGTVGAGELSFHTAMDSHLIAFAAEESRVSGAPVSFAAWVDALGLGLTASSAE
ncbi:Gfo/Idh/MocA family oxidoreductase [Microbacterium sp. zg.Y1090]|uniref:Gfo/Idh/MocA family protein n=1 Tax=Microbacterium wangruii TaxID=3049073 RepID=UPI00214D3AA5|nr:MULTISPECIES: Gfo/Idh/MocA family oxidoreductase [unclassified Microbacterium]MCR2818810.1 Gfo/Idh/MocA family oxidoreductase [Microbacterium sp. zg.Y1090]WIM27124.1 Gfo/Idh/MocA family oxidoreductase [Microbacterium sp. zg-Y1090]